MVDILLVAWDREVVRDFAHEILIEHCSDFTSVGSRVIATGTHHRRCKARRRRCMMQVRSPIPMPDKLAFVQTPLHFPQHLVTRFHVISLISHIAVVSSALFVADVYLPLKPHSRNFLLMRHAKGHSPQEITTDSCPRYHGCASGSTCRRKIYRPATPPHIGLRSSTH